MRLLLLPLGVVLLNSRAAVSLRGRRSLAFGGRSKQNLTDGAKLQRNLECWRAKIGDFPEKCSNLIQTPVPRDQARRSTYSRRGPGQIFLSRAPELEVTLKLTSVN